MIISMNTRGIDEFNELAHTLLGVRDKGELEKYEAALVLGKHTESVKDLINLAQNLDLYRFYPDISNEEELGAFMRTSFTPLRYPSISRTISIMRHTGGM